MKCAYCDSTFSNNSSLKYHQKTAKYCLAKRPDFLPEKYRCAMCDKDFTLKETYNRHLMSCTQSVSSLKLQNKIDNLITELNRCKTQLDEKDNRLQEKDEQMRELLAQKDEQIKELQNKLENIAIKAVSRPTSTTTNNNTTKTENLIISDWRPETIIEKVATQFTIEHLQDGLKGVARFTDEHIIKDSDGKRSVVCSDPARMIFKYKDENGVVQKDVKATKLKNAIKEPIIKKSCEMFTTESARLFDILTNAPDEDETNTNTFMDIVDVTTAKMDNLVDNFTQVKLIDNNADIYAKELALLTS